MPSLYQGSLVLGLILTAIGGLTAFLSSSQNRTPAFSLCCVTMGALMLIMGFFWAVKGKRTPVGYSSENALNYSQVFTPLHGSNVPASASVNSHMTVERESRGGYEEDFDFDPPMEPSSLNPPPWNLEPPPPYEVAIKTTTSSTHLRRTYSDTLRPTEPLFGCSREISFEV